MTFPPLLSILSTTPFFATRPFLSTLVLALLARFTSLLSFAPTWFTSNRALAILAVLALADIFIAKSDEFRRVLDDFGTPIRAFVNLLVAFFLLRSQTVDPTSLTDLIGGTGEVEGFDFLESIQLSASVIAFVWSIICAASVWLLSELRASIWRAVSDVDEGDDLGIQSVLSWVEDVWSITGVLIAVVFPLVAIAVYGATLLALFITQKSIVHLQERRKVPCQNCSHPLIATAVTCPNCGHHNHTPLAVGLLGQAKSTPVQDLATHRHQLRTRKRCPVCATRLSHRRVQQSCSACSTVTFSTEQELADYLAIIATKLPKTLLICGALSFLPVVGIIPGIIFYHLYLISGLRGYVPRSIGCFTRWGIIALNLLLIAFQWVPFVGALMLPLMCLISYRVYRSVLEREGRRLFGHI